MSLLLAHTTNEQLRTIIAQPAHALLLVAPEGAGKAHVARWLAAHILGIEPVALARAAHVHIFQPDEKQTIGVETARAMTSSLTLKTVGTQPIRRIVIIEDAHTMTIEAQNTLLKTLEEPPLDTVIIMTASDRTQLLPTILSRVQAHSLDRPTLQQAQTYFQSDGNTADEIEKAYLMSGGLVGLMRALLRDESHPLADAIEEAKRLLRADVFTRLQAVDALHKKPRSQHILFALSQIAHAALVLDATTKQAAKTDSLQRWAGILTTVQQAREQLARNTQAKLVFTNLMLHL